MSQTHLVVLGDRGPAALQADLASAAAARRRAAGRSCRPEPAPTSGSDSSAGRRSGRARCCWSTRSVDNDLAAGLAQAMTAGSPSRGQGWLRAGASDLAAPLVTAARSFEALQALVVVAARPRRRLTTGPRPLLSASLIVKDEQTALPTCLASLDGRVDEVVVCDTGSSDRTVEIAEAFGARVVRTPWTQDFAAARNVPLAQCQGAWVLSIDADERLVAPRAGDLRRALTPRGVPAYGVLIRSLTDDAAQGVGFEHEAIRLFRTGRPGLGRRGARDGGPPANRRAAGRPTASRAAPGPRRLPGHRSTASGTRQPATCCSPRRTTRPPWPAPWAGRSPRRPTSWRALCR